MKITIGNTINQNRAFRYKPPGRIAVHGDICDWNNDQESKYRYTRDFCEISHGIILVLDKFFPILAFDQPTAGSAELGRILVMHKMWLRLLSSMAGRLSSL